ncbi:MAG: hypothetical protein C0618_09370 [Desulfuromonas sp.]|nr:MAG: hypothetical protein C0618_09370 [Desulfuromonas sp.]
MDAGRTITPLLTVTAGIRRAQFWLFLGYCTWLSLTPAPQRVLVDNFSDKTLHAVGYLLLMLSCDLAHRSGRSMPLKLLLLLGYSALIELIQHLLPHREFSTGDLLANLTGLLCAVLLIRMTHPYLSRINHRFFSS